MRGSLLVLWSLGGTIALGGPAVTWTSYTRTRSSATAETARLDSIREKTNELRALRTTDLGQLARVKNDEALATRISKVLGHAGVAASSLSSFSPQSERLTLGAEHVTKQRATVVLAPITLPKLGSFLASWRSAEPEWTVSGIEVAPESGAGSTPGADLPLRVTLTIESLAIDDAGATS